MHKAVKQICKELTDALEGELPPEDRRRLWYDTWAALRHRLGMEYASDKVEKFSNKISSGFE